MTFIVFEILASSILIKHFLVFRKRSSEELGQPINTWKHKPLREIPIPKKDGLTRILKIPTIADRAWQCLVKYALEPAHEATFHARSYGFIPLLSLSGN
jgi:retron-type reverse transcriptase